MTKQIHNREYLKSRRKDLRNNLTPAEAKLWSVLKNKQFNDKKFRRQQSIDNYIVDFYCPEEKLVIELDGEIHDEWGIKQYDMERSHLLEKLGCKILRFKNKMILEQLDDVLIEIEKCF